MLSFYLSTQSHIQIIPSNIHSEMHWIARKTIQMKIIKPEQDSNLHLPITGRLFFQLNYPIFSHVFEEDDMSIQQNQLHMYMQDNSNPVLFYLPIAARVP